MYHVRLPPSWRGHRPRRSPDAVADAVWFVAVFLLFGVVTWLVFGEILGGNPGRW